MKKVKKLAPKTDFEHFIAYCIMVDIVHLCQCKFFYICSALIVGGGIGNLIDRIFYGYVIDYLSLSFFPPVCNFADYCITAGTVMLIIYVMFFAESKKADANKPELNKVINNND